MEKRIQNLGKKKTFISLDEIEKMADIEEHKNLVSLIKSLVEGNIIKPILTSKRTYKIPSIYTKYRIVKDEEDFSEYLNELNYKIYYKLDIGYYKNHIDSYKRDRGVILTFSEFMLNSANELDTKLSLNERSFQIFKNEKLLSTSECQGILGNLGVNINDLNIYRTPEPFFYYLNKDEESTGVLIIENKDTWYTFRELLREGKSIMGIKYKALIYGEGRKILSSFRDIDIDEYMEFNTKDNTFYYFGDIDKEGLAIYVSLKKKFGEYSIEPFIKGYRYLINNYDLARKKDISKDITLSYKELYIQFSGLEEEEVNKMIDICKRNAILPQEILNNKVLRGELYEREK